MDEVEKTAALQVLTDGTFAQKEPVKVISDIQNNRMAKLPIGVQNSVRLLKKQGMSNTEIAKQLRSLRSDQINFEENEQAAVNARAEEALKKLKADVITAMGQGNTDAFNTAIAALRANHPLEATTLEEKFIEAGRRRTVSDPDVRSNLVNLISSAELSFDDVAAAVADGTLSNKDIEYFQGKANSIENEEFAETANFMRGLFELPANYTAIKDTDPNYEKARIFARLRGNLERRLTQARQTRQEFDAFEIMEELVANETGAITSVENQIKIASGNKIIGLINGFERELAQIGQDKFEEGAFQSAIDFLQAQKRLESRNRIPALRNRDDQSIAGFIKNLTDALEVSQ
jgi:antitoxin component of RelBE/YafQ-DinJ toxin-antitoxin module